MVTVSGWEEGRESVLSLYLNRKKLPQVQKIKYSHADLADEKRNPAWQPLREIVRGPGQEGCHLLLVQKEREADKASEKELSAVCV